ncbi:MAG: YncE family protein [Burkholderiales bacterium]|nr:YncE family protein [Burkholderiales bacterium]
MRFPPPSACAARVFNVLRRHAGFSAVFALVAALASSSVPAKPYSFIALHDQNRVAVFDHATNAWVGSITVGNAPIGVGVGAGEKTAYVTNHLSNSLSVVRVANRAVVATVPVGAQPMGVAVATGQPRAYVANYAANTVSVVDVNTQAVLATINVGEGPTAVLSSATGDRVFVANTIGNTVSVIATASNVVTHTLNVTHPDNPNTRPYALAFVTGGAGSRLLVANNNAASVSIFDGATYASTALVAVDAQPTALAVATPNKVYALGATNAVVHAIDPYAGTVIAGPVSAASGAMSMATASNGSVGSVAGMPASLQRLNTTSNALTALPAIPAPSGVPLTLGQFVVNPSFECALDVNDDDAFNGTDTTLIARYLAGFRGAGLVAGVPGVTAGTVEALLATTSLDADNDGQQRLATDGVLLHRVASGVVGPALIANARNPVPPTAFTTSTQLINWIVSTHGANCLP